MSRISQLFQRLWDNYPLGTAEQVKQGIGGHVNAAWITNTCTIRLSRAFNYSGEEIPDPAAAKVIGMNVVSGADKKWYAYRVSEFHKYMQSKYGMPLTVQGNGTIPASILSKKGVIEFVVAFSDATGHFDVWNGAKCKYEEFFARAKTINLWS
ncbi:MAG: type VI secretion system amidase effector protein Tae4 [Isosphaeraceae bacterium]